MGLLVEALKLVGQAVINEFVRKQTGGLFSSYEELKEWNEFTKSLGSKDDDDDFSIFDLR